MVQKFKATEYKARSWYLIRVLFKISDKHPCPFYIGPHLGEEVGGGRDPASHPWGLSRNTMFFHLLCATETRDKYLPNGPLGSYADLSHRGREQE